MVICSQEVVQEHYDQFEFISIDHINIPPMKDFRQVEEYYATTFHECIHSTGHVSRLKRIGVTSATAHFGSEEYTQEEP
ncbi:zincin-like metallopeptidase domain-containing protein, partial [Bacillus sp. EB600]|uniref:zincin-like metallopeptidase domain-containing protein n=1 Tax=Bacillus sp. EB600 TaxID=2806345 RepID=UPI00210C700A